MGIKVRNEKIDIVRGFAILLVVMGHTLSSIAGATDTFFYNVIFAVQMPLFMIISGYVTIYSKPITSIGGFWTRIKKRTISLLLPWLVWTLIKYCVFSWGQPFGQYMLYIFEHMDTGYWFLFSLWTIDLIVSFSSFLSNIGKQKSLNKYLHIVIQFAYIGVMFVALAVLGYKVGMNVLAIKYSLYYMPFFCLGYLFGMLYSDVANFKWFDITSTVISAISLIAFGLLCVNFNVQQMEDNLLNTSIRIVMSLLGCGVIFWVFHNVKCAGKAWSVIKYFGVHSLELYVIHYFFLLTINTEDIVINSLQGVITFILNYALCLISSTALIYIINLNFISRRILLGKK